MRQFIIVLVALSFLVSCAKEEESAPQVESTKEQKSTPMAASHHGAIVALGAIKLANETFSIARHGEPVPGKECAFVVSRLGAGTKQGLFLWVEDQNGGQLSAPAQGDLSGNEWHFHITPRAGSLTPSRVILRLREGGLDERAGLALHAGAAPTHDGVAAPVLGPDNGTTGWLELKLHDDKGDLELWLTKDGVMRQPLDLPLGSVIKVTFPEMGNRTVDLRVRNTTKNEDEDGKPNVRNGRTNYFIFPGDTGADATWLQGSSFKSTVSMTATLDGKSLSAGPFVLVPHGHGAGDHEHK